MSALSLLLQHQQVKLQLQLHPVKLRLRRQHQLVRLQLQLLSLLHPHQAVKLLPHLQHHQQRQHHHTQLLHHLGVPALHPLVMQVPLQSPATATSGP